MPMQKISQNLRSDSTAKLTLCRLLLAGLVGLVVTPLVAQNETPFTASQPIWPAGLEKQMNCSVGFRSVFSAPPGGEAVLRLAASSVYRVFLNGEFLGYGPARGPHGYHRVDEWRLHNRLQPGQNYLSIEVTAYNVNSYYLADQPGFLQAEVVADRKVLASTAGKGNRFTAQLLSSRVRNVQRYSFQRPFIEIYRLEAGCDDWRQQVGAAFIPVKCAPTEAKKYLPRRVPYPDFIQRPALGCVGKGRVESVPLPARLWKDRSLTKINPQFRGFPESELAAVPSLEMQGYRSTLLDSNLCGVTVGETQVVGEKEYLIHDLGVNLTGFIGSRVQCTRPTRVVFLFDEILSRRDVDFKRLGCVNIVSYELQPGEYQIESFEPYTLRYLKTVVLQGECRISDVYLREYVNPEAQLAKFSCSDRNLNRLFEAARETFRQNAVDVFMDCPSRERAGWLCDSYFTSRVALDLCGNTLVEKNFLENFLLPDRFPDLPAGMLPMCYPADHPNVNFIPNWALWFVVQLQEYLQRSGDRELVDALHPRVEQLFAYLADYKNSDGLLEKLPAWVFVEWSKANDFVQDVNYPSNMLYAGALEAAGQLYQRQEYLEQAQAVRATILRQSFDGEFFVDNAVREQNGLQVTRNRTEACQYYAFYFQVVTPESHAELWEKLVRQFGPVRKTDNRFPDVHPANTFVGDYLRLELLSRAGLVSQILDESRDFFLYMAERTGTLWENRDERASCNHGFASHIAHVLVRDVLGLYAVDVAQKKIILRINPVQLDWCAAQLPIPGGTLRLAWWYENGTQKFEISQPLGWEVSNETDFRETHSRKNEAK
jgi:alpha-L-rhamnosidase